MKKFYNLILLDESGSMGAIRYSAISAMNETLQTIKNEQDRSPHYEHTISFITFSGSGVEGVKFVGFNVPAESMKELSEADYTPDGCTPLNDAIGTAVEALQKLVKKGDVVLVSIITDGMENSSYKYSGEQIRSLIERQKERGWTFTYMGANQDSRRVAGDMGICNALNFDADNEGVAIAVKSFNCCYESFCQGEKLENQSNFFIDTED